MDFGCAAYCKYAEQCLGDLPPELLAQREHLLKDRVAVEAKKRYGRNFKSISSSIKAARYAEELLRSEKGDPAVVIMAAHLHAVPSVPGGVSKSPEESAQAAKEIMEGLSIRKEIIDEVCELILSQNDRTENLSGNKAIFKDALILSELEEKLKHGPIKKDHYNSLLHSQAAKKIADELVEKYGG